MCDNIDSVMYNYRYYEFTHFGCGMVGIKNSGPSIFCTIVI